MTYRDVTTFINRNCDIVFTIERPTYTILQYPFVMKLRANLNLTRHFETETNK